MNTRVRTRQDTELRGSDQHWVTENAMPPSWSSFVYKAVHKLPPRSGVAALSLCTSSLPSFSFARVLPLTSHFGTECSLRAAQGLKHQLCLACVLPSSGRKTDGSLSHTPETRQPGVLQFRFGWLVGCCGFFS